MATKRFYVSWMGEYYMDALRVEAILKGRTQANEAASLLGAKLQEREEKRRKMVDYLAQKRGIPYQEMYQQLVSGTYSPSTDELNELDEEE